MEEDEGEGGVKWSPELVAPMGGCAAESCLVSGAVTDTSGNVQPGHERLRKSGTFRSPLSFCFLVFLHPSSGAHIRNPTICPTTILARPSPCSLLPLFQFVLPLRSSLYLPFFFLLFTPV